MLRLLSDLLIPKKSEAGPRSRSLCSIRVGLGQVKQPGFGVMSLAVLAEGDSHLFPDFIHDLCQQDGVRQRHPRALLKSCGWRGVKRGGNQTD